MKNRLFILLVLLFLPAGDAVSFDFITGRGIGIGRTVMLSRSSASALLLVPSGGISDGQAKVELAVLRRFEIKDLDQALVAAAYRKNAVTYSVGLTQFGHRDLYSEQTARFAVAFHFDSLTVGAAISAMLVEFGGHYDRLSGSTLGAGISYRFGRLFGAFTAENLTSPKLYENSEGIRPKYSIYAEIIGKGSYSIAGRLTLEDREKPQFGVGQKIELERFGSLFWGLSTKPILYGGGIEFLFRGSAISYATSYHPTLGFSHTVGVTYDFGSSARK